MSRFYHFNEIHLRYSPARSLGLTINNRVCLERRRTNSSLMMSTNKNVDYEWKFDHKKLIKFRASARPTRRAGWWRTFLRFETKQSDVILSHELVSAKLMFEFIKEKRRLAEEQRTIATRCRRHSNLCLFAQEPPMYGMRLNNASAFRLFSITFAFNGVEV